MKPPDIKERFPDNLQQGRIYFFIGAVYLIFGNQDIPGMDIRAVKALCIFKNCFIPPGAHIFNNLMHTAFIFPVAVGTALQQLV